MNANFCEHCGGKVSKNDELATQTVDYHSNQHSTYQESDQLETTIDDRSHQYFVDNSLGKDMLIYVGKNHEYYERKWKVAEEKNGHSWNLASFIFSATWLGYRKMYKEVLFVALFFLLCDFLLYFVDSLYDISSSLDSINHSLTIGVAVFIGFYGNTLYKRHTEKNTILIRNQEHDPARREFLLKQKGGASWGGVVIAIVMMLVFYVFPAMFIPINDDSIQAVKSGTFYEYPDVPVEDLFESVFEETTWDKISSESDYNVVEFTGTKDVYDSEYLVQIQFTYDGSEFEVTTISVDGSMLKDYEIFDFLDYIFTEYDGQ